MSVFEPLVDNPKYVPIYRVVKHVENGKSSSYLEVKVNGKYLDINIDSMINEVMDSYRSGFVPAMDMDVGENVMLKNDNLLDLIDDLLKPKVKSLVMYGPVASESVDPLVIDSSIDVVSKEIKVVVRPPCITKGNKITWMVRPINEYLDDKGVVVFYPLYVGRLIHNDGKVVYTYLALTRSDYRVVSNYLNNR